MHKEITVRPIGEENKEDISLPNEPFEIFGRLVPSYIREEWSYTAEYFPERSQICFPDEKYEYGEPGSVYIGAYCEEKCVGVAVLKEAPFGYMYLYDLKVNRAYRREGVAGALLGKAKEIASGRGYRGIYTQAQDNNLGACLFYLKEGFVIGGLDTMVYRGTPQEHKNDIFFYLDI